MRFLDFDYRNQGPLMKNVNVSPSGRGSFVKLGVVADWTAYLFDGRNELSYVCVFGRLFQLTPQAELLAGVV